MTRTRSRTVCGPESDAVSLATGRRRAVENGTATAEGRNQLAEKRRSRNPALAQSGLLEERRRLMSELASFIANSTSSADHPFPGEQGTSE